LVEVKLDYENERRYDTCNNCNDTCNIN